MSYMKKESFFKLQKNLTKALLAAGRIASILDMTCYIYHIDGNHYLFTNTHRSGEYLTIKP